MTGASLEVIAEQVIDGKDCYVTQGSFESPIGGVIKNVLLVFEKATMFLLRARMSGEYQGSPFIKTSRYSYEFLDEPYYPLQVGKECRVTKTEIMTTTMLGRTKTETRTMNYTYQVEGIEEITVPAGTFRCFKIVQYSSNDNALITHWESDRVRQYEVKTIDHETGEVFELISSDSGLTRLN